MWRVVRLKGRPDFAGSRKPSAGLHRVGHGVTTSGLWQGVSCVDGRPLHLEGATDDLEVADARVLQHEGVRRWHPGITLTLLTTLRRFGRRKTFHKDAFSLERCFAAVRP
jgi:hypothetical protein